MAPISWKPSFRHSEPKPKHATLSYPAPNTLLVTLNRPKDLNCINLDGQAELETIWSWLDEEPGMSVGIITGAGRAFCAGADLKGWSHSHSLNCPARLDCFSFTPLT